MDTLAQPDCFTLAINYVGAKQPESIASNKATVATEIPEDVISVIDDDTDIDEDDDISVAIHDDASSVVSIVDIDEDEDEDEDDIHDDVHDDDLDDINEPVEPEISDEKIIQEHVDLYVVPTDKRTTSDVMSLYDWTNVTSTRATHIASGGPYFVDPGEDVTPIRIAEKEVREGKCPMTIRKELGNNIIEIWDVNELLVPF